MATAVASASPIDLRSTNSQPVRLGDSIQKATGARYTTVRYNHKPSISHEDDSTTSIVQGKKPGRRILSLKDGDDEYEYEGALVEADQTYILLPEKKGEGYVLEKLGGLQSYNLRQVPWESDATKLASQYPQLEVLGKGGHDEGNRHRTGQPASDDDTPDVDNPFDFRNYMHLMDSPSPNLGQSHQARPSTPTMFQSASQQGTPTAKPSRKAGSAFAPQQKKSKHATKNDSAAADRKRVKLSPPEARSQAVPTVRLDRKASVQLPRKQNTRSKTQVQDISLGDDGDLIIEGDASSSYPGKRSLGLALTGQLGQGPISLRSAASSPATRVNSPMGSRPDANGRIADLDGDLEMDDASSVPRAHKLPPRHDDESDRDSDEDADAEADDDDVDALELPSPAQEHRPSVSGTVVTADDDDDLERQMLMAMEQDDDDGVAPAKAESDEESEEE